MPKILTSVFSITLLLISTVQAKQLSFIKKEHKDYYSLSYQWLNYNNEQQAISFTLTKPALFNRFRTLKPYKSEFVQKAILRSIRKQLKKTPLTGARVIFTQQQGKTVMQVKGMDEEKVAAAYKQIKVIEQEATAQYFKQNYYQRFITHDNQTGIKVDHINIALDSLADFKALKPILLDKVSIEDKVSTEDIRKVTDFVLSFVQSIPYSTLESRLSSSGAGFNPPAKLLWENQGDCDSKMTLTAAILRTLMPRIDIAMIYIDEHAFIGISVPAKGNEVSIEFQGINYLLSEPTGPALYKLGELAPESELAINQGRYVAEKFYSEKSL